MSLVNKKLYVIVRANIVNIKDVHLIHASGEKEILMKKLKELTYIDITEKEAEEGFRINQTWYLLKTIDVENQ